VATVTCETCEVKDWGHKSDGSLIPVWENPADYKRGEAPDYIGCTECHTMRKYPYREGSQAGDGE